MVEIIAEIANAHQGDPEAALKIACAAAEAGVDSVKFQVYFARELLTEDHPQFGHFNRLSFTEKIWERLLKESRKSNVRIYADVFGADAARVAAGSSVDGFKIHSSDLTNDLLLEVVARAGKKVFLGTGGSTLMEIRHALKLLKSAGGVPEIVLLHGFQAYPTRIEDTVLSRLRMLSELFGPAVRIGYSDHADAESKFSTILPFMALGYGVSCIEKHITLNRAEKGTDYYSSLNPEEMRQFVKDIKASESAIGENPITFSASEEEYRKKVKKHWVAIKDIPIREIITRNDILMKRASASAHPLEINKIAGVKAVCAIKKGQPITSILLPHKVLAVIVARLGSSRLENKALLDINGEPAIAHLFKRVGICKEAGVVDSVAFCTTTEPQDDTLVSIAGNYSFMKVYRGSVANVLSRMLLAMDDHRDHDVIVRITGDDLLIDCTYLKKTLAHHLETNAHYTNAKDLPSGVEAEIFSSDALRFIHDFALDYNGSEYLTNYIMNNKSQFNISHLAVSGRHARTIRLTMDTKEDYEVIYKLLAQMKAQGKEFSYSLDDIIYFFEKNQDIELINSRTRQKPMPLTISTGINWMRLCREWDSR